MILILAFSTKRSDSVMWHPFKAATSRYGLIFWGCHPVKVANLTVARDSFSSCSEHIDVWSEIGNELEDKLFEEQSKNVIFAF